MYRGDSKSFIGFIAPKIFSIIANIGIN